MPTVAPLDLDGYCVAARYIGTTPFFALADGTVHRIADGLLATQVHDGILAATPTLDRKALVTAGEDGRVRRITEDGTIADLADIGRKWIGQLAAGPHGAVAFATGRNAYVLTSDGTLKEIACPRSVEGLAFAPKGLRIAVARYNGATLYWPGMDARPLELEWKGSHTAASFSPDGKYLITAMQENALHGWRLSDNHDMRMSGYPAKIKSIDWSANGKWLATGGAPAAVVWPFTGKDGPMGKAPLELGTRGDSLVTTVACHPKDEVAVIGYNDGMVLAVRFADDKEILLRRPGKGAITSLDWSRDGRRVVFGSASGDCGIVDLGG